MVASDGNVDVVEKKLLVQACNGLRITRERYTEISREAVTMIKSFRLLETQAASVGLGSSLGRAGITLEMGSRPASSLPAGIPKALEEDVAPALSRPAPGSVRREEAVALSADATGTKGSQPEPSVHGAESERALPAPTPKMLWYCPACAKPQFRDFSECPQCGVIVEKFLAAKGGARRGPVPPASAEVPPIAETVVPEGLPLPSPESDEAPIGANSGRKFCIHCGERLGSSDKFCTSCGSRTAVGGD
jgi:hypothetical protein